MALHEACQEIVWTHALLTEMGIDVTLPMAVYGDYQACFDLIQNNLRTSILKHQVVKSCFIRELDDQGVVKLIKIRSEDQTADMLTKPLGRHQFEKHKTALDLRVVAIAEPL